MSQVRANGQADDCCPEGWIWVELEVGHDGAGRRADVWLALRFPHFSRSAVARFFRQGRIRGGDRPLKRSSILMRGERLRFCRPPLEADCPAPPLPTVLYEDERMVAFDKPAGMLVHPSGGRFVWALNSLARLARPELHLHLVHRLDRDTSGVVLMAKDSEANRHLKAVFHDQLAEKVYWAICRGWPSWSTALTDAPIGDDQDSAIRIKMGVRPDGQQARTRFYLRARFAELCLVEAHPRSGRTHQIRVHLEHLGLPILGDRIYGQPDELFLRIQERGFDAWALERAGLPRQALHARILRLPHPDGHPLEIRAPLPADMRQVLRDA